MDEVLKIGDAAKVLGVTTRTLRHWDHIGKLKPYYTTEKGTRYYQKSTLLRLMQVNEDNPNKVVGYCRVSNKKQKSYLDNQIELMTTYLKYRYDNYEVITDIGSGINYNKKGLNTLIQMIHNREISKIVVTHKDRLVRFGFELVETFAKLNGIEIIVIEDVEVSEEEELVQDVLQILTVYSDKLNGKKSYIKNKLNEL